ncbi:MAG TPA: cytochrome c oxidase subunit II [Acidimicrobiales bacterium]|nr:cytochrome c oxidase subunit II [Acidimicrobiales bacterium]
MSAPPPSPARHELRRRWAVVLGGVLLALVLGGCQLPNFYGFRGADKQGHDEFLLYFGTFVAAIVVGVITGGLILWSVLRYRRRDDHMPRQFQYHVPLELTYTVVPVIIVLVLFAFTVVVENKVDAVPSDPNLTVDVYAFQWGWEFDYPNHVVVRAETTSDPDPVGPSGLGGPACSPAAWCLGPGLVLPSGQTTQIDLRSRDVIHGFFVPEFNFSRYAQPGVLNEFDFTVNHPGVFRAQCTQLCGLYHSLMFFHVVAMPPAKFQAWLSSEASSGSTGGPPSTPQSKTTVPTTPNTGVNAP